jgi:2-succinyl-5-enolpyruvyl-6-hydroxy-3-cyclohexene-1-carboxylate synthase
MNSATCLSLVLADELARCGVKEIVVAPGGRSGPLAQALHHTAARAGQRLHTRFDERAAGFLALGLARATRQPVVVICTSGSAAANLHPAVLEACHSHIPIIVVTADRPPELRGTGASQVTDQVKLFGTAVQLFAEVGLPDTGNGDKSPSPSANSYWRSLICRSVTAASRGPVHLNVPLREPLTFDAPNDFDARFPGRAGDRPWVDVARHQPAPAAPHGLGIPAGSRGVVIVGDDAPDAPGAVAFAEAAGWPLLAEPQSNARGGPNAMVTYRYLLGHPATRRRLMPEIVVTVGRAGVSREILALMSDVTEHIVVDPHLDWSDPTRTACTVLPEIPCPAGPAADPSWLADWRAADRVARAALNRFLDDSGQSEPRLIRDVLNHLPDDSLCFIGSSMPIRDAEVTMPELAGVRIVCNRGLAGIDGNISTAVGAALAHQAGGGGKAYAIMGDLTFLHDATGLIGCAGAAQPDLTLIVINNQGGGIFSLVGYTADAIGFDQLFATPHSVDIGGLAAATGWNYELIADPVRIIEMLNDQGPRIIEVQTDRQANAKLHQRVKQHINQLLDEMTVSAIPPHR